jgi:signal peptidase II
VLAIVAVCVLAIDQFAKYLVIENLEQGDVYDVLGQVLQFRFVKNPGAAFSLLSGSTWIFAIIASAVAVFIVVFARRIRSLPWAVLFGLLLGGNLGNLTDRLFREPGFGVGHVIDYIQIIWFPAIFNIADMAIVFSMAIFILLTIRSVPLTGVKPVAGDDASTAALLAEPAPDVAADAAPAPTPDPADDSPATGRP